MELEIGFGNGESLQRASLAFPERDFIGVELAWNSLKRAMRRLASPPRENVRLLWMPAEAALELLFAPESLSFATCLFPVPWPNEKQAGKRLATRRFLNLLANRLAPGGVFRMVTDHEGLAAWTMEQSKDSAMRLALETSPAIMDTKYERKWLLGGQNLFYHLNGTKRAHPEARVSELSQMPPRFSALSNPRDYRPEGRTGAPSIIFGELIYDELKGEGLLQTKVVEDHFVQEFHIRLKNLGDGRFKLAPALPGQVLPTAGVGLALDLAALDPSASRRADFSLAAKNPEIPSLKTLSPGAGPLAETPSQGAAR